MSSDEERNKQLYAIVAWREAADAHPVGQRKMKEAERDLQRLGPSQDQGPPGLVINIVDPERPRE